MGVENASRDVEELEDIGVAHGIDHRSAVPLGGDDASAAEHGQLLRNRRWRRADRRLHLANAHRPLPQQLEDPDPDRMRERLEEFRLELAEPLGVIRALVRRHARNSTGGGASSQLPNVAKHGTDDHTGGVHADTNPAAGATDPGAADADDSAKLAALLDEART